MSFWEKGYDALYIKEFYGNPYEHTIHDTIDKISTSFLMKAASAVTLVALTLAGE